MLQSVVSLPDGFTIVVGGLEVETESEAVSRVPLLGSIPFLGHLFRNQSKSTTKNRFFVFIRCTVLRRSNFEDLKYLSEGSLDEAGLDDSWPRMEPRIIR